MLRSLVLLAIISSTALSPTSSSALALVSDNSLSGVAEPWSFGNNLEEAYDDDIEVVGVYEPSSIELEKRFLMAEVFLVVAMVVMAAFLLI